MAQTEQLIAGRYKILNHLASGGMATVFKAWDSRVGRIVAMKMLRTLDKGDLRAVERFRREARAAAALMHKNAVTIYDFVEETGQYFLVMEYVNGPTLKQYIAMRQRLSAFEALLVVEQVCSVLKVAHEHRFIHRDIKPQNIILTWQLPHANTDMITEKTLVKLTDFGIVRVVEDPSLTNSGIVLGTADYLSPEQARGERLQAPSDLYSLGVVLFEILSGQPPFTGPTAVSIAMQHATSRPPKLQQVNVKVSPCVESIVTRSLAKELEYRFTSAQEMLEAVQNCKRTFTAAR